MPVRAFSDNIVCPLIFHYLLNFSGKAFGPDKLWVFYAVQRLIFLQEEGSRYSLGITNLRFFEKHWSPTSIGGSIGYKNEEERPHHGSPPNESAKVLYRTEDDNESDDVYYDEP